MNNILNTEIINYNNDLYVVKHRFKISQIKEDKVSALRDFLDTNIVLKNQDCFLFCEKIEDASIIETIESNENN